MASEKAVMPRKASLLLEHCEQPSKQTLSPGCGPTQECAIIGNVCSLPGWEPDNTTQRKKREKISRPPCTDSIHPLIGLGRWADPGLNQKYACCSLLGRGEKSTLFLEMNTLLCLWPWIVSLPGDFMEYQKKKKKPSHSDLFPRASC